MRTRHRVRNTLVISGFLFVVVQIVWWTEPMWLFSALRAIAPGIVWRVDTHQPLVALSFDDGPHPLYTPQVLALLAQHDAHATFFLIGERAAAHPDLVAAIKAGGHEVGSHSLHPGTTLGTGGAFRDNLVRAERAIGVSSPKLFRPPSGLAWPWQLREARELGYVAVLGSAYPHDPDHPPVGYIRWLVEKNLVPGAIVILHDGISDPSRGIQALPGILAEGQRRGIHFVTIGTLLGSVGAAGHSSGPRVPARGTSVIRPVNGC
jgi:peptidoglycan/xylan/chitin deacetylase (PgdA/CDA1 family)